MPEYIKELTEKQKAAMPEFAQEWIKIGLRTGDTDWATFDKYMPICYEKAGLKYPPRIVRVSSPLVGALAAAVAEGIWKKRRGAVRGAVSGAVDSAVRGAVDGAVRGAVDSAVGGAVGDAVGGAVGGAVGDAVGDAVGGAVDGAVRGAVDSAVRGAVSDAVGGAVGGAVGDAVRGAVDSAVGGAVRGAVDSAVRGAVDGAVRGAVDSAVGGAVGDAVGGAVDSAVKTAIRIAKKAEVSISWHYWLGGQFWVGNWWYGAVASVAFLMDVCKLKLATDIVERATAYRKVCESVNYFWPNRDFVMVCARPARIEKDGQGRLHSLTDMAIKYPDGWGLYCINGVRFDDARLWRAIADGSISAAEVFAIPNMEQRRVAYECMDKVKMKDLPNFKVLDEVKDDGYGYPMRVVSFTLEGFDDPFLYLNCHCPSTGREYYLETRQATCAAAKAKSFGYDSLEFDEEY